MASINNTPRPAYVYDTATNEWIPIGVGAHSHNEIPKTVVDAKGDLIVGTAADEVNRLAVGSNGYTLVADSSTSTGLAYSGTTNGNPVINGGMDIWQRGTSISLAASTAAANGFLADRWQCYTNANQACTVSRQATGDTTNLPNIQYALRFQRNSGQTGTGAIPVIQNIESTNSIPYAGRTVTLSFYARAGANFSAASSQLAVYLVTGTGTDQNNIVGAGYTSGTNIVSSTATLTTTWQRFTYTASVGSTATQLGVQWNYTPVGTAGANDYFEVTGVQLDLGSTALPFRRSGGTIQGELAACQRYFYVIASGDQQSITNGFYSSASDCRGNLRYPVPMRGTPTLTTSVGTDHFAFETSAGVDGLNRLDGARISANSLLIYNNAQAAGTAGNSGELRTNSASASFTASAEL